MKEKRLIEIRAAEDEGMTVEGYAAVFDSVTDLGYMKEVIDTLANYGAWNAANLDGGTSTQLVINGQLKNNPKNIYGNKVEGGRSVVTGWGLIPGAGKTETETE